MPIFIILNQVSFLIHYLKLNIFYGDSQVYFYFDPRALKQNDMRWLKWHTYIADTNANLI
jgi:hypothetical protein